MTDRDMQGLVVALDIDGVLIDPERGGKGPWFGELSHVLGVDSSDMIAELARRWDDLLYDERSLTEHVSEMLSKHSLKVQAEDMVEWWLSADATWVDDMVVLAASWADRGARLVLATDTHELRALHLAEQLRTTVPLFDVFHPRRFGCQKSSMLYFQGAQQLLQNQGISDPVIFIDDLPLNIHVARDFGWVAVPFSSVADSSTRVDAAAMGLREGLR